MNSEEVWETWAPSGARWSDWVKPVLFATLPDDELDTAESPPSSDVELTAELTAPGVALVVDLPGKDSVAVGIALATRGIRPVPLFNALPGGEEQLIDVDSIQRALVAGANAVRASRLPSDAPPAFLLDSLRRVPRQHLRTRSYFDNRSVSFSSDFPSAAALRAAGIQRIVLLRRWYLRVPGDLIGTLAGWHAAGLAIEIHDAMSENARLLWAPPSLLWLRRFWYETLIPLTFPRDDEGVFGGRRQASS